MITNAHLSQVILDKVTLCQQKHIILNQCSVQFAAEGISFVMGENGAGKSQLLRLIHGFSTPSSGRLSAPHHFEQAFLHQSPLLLQRNVGENLRYIRGTKVCSTGFFDSNVQRVLSFFSLSDTLSQSVNTLSGGQKKRVALARLLLQQADYYLLDEPSANIDRQNNVLIEAAINDLVATQKKVIIATHDYPQLARLFVPGRDEIVCLKKGQVTAQLKELDLATLHQFM